MDPGEHSWLQRVAERTEMGRAVLAFDWADTPLGPVDGWPPGLRSAVSICLTTNFPALVVWGPDLIKIYNDAYQPMLGRSKHPGALGAPVALVWPELWPQISGMFDDVMTTGVPTWSVDQQLVVHRNGYAEEGFFTFSYSPLYDDGHIAGVLDLVFETTEQVLTQRRLECLTALGAALATAEQITDVCVAAASALALHSPELRAIDLHLCVEDELVLVASNRRDLPPALDLAAIGPDTPMLIDGDRSGALPANHVAARIGGSFGGMQGVVVCSLNQQRAFDASYRRFVRAIAETISSALEAASRRSIEIGLHRHISDTLQAAMLPPSSDLPTIAARYLPAVGNLAVGGDWYDLLDLDANRRALVVGDCVGHGLEAATVMAQLRSACRAMLLEGRRPAGVLEGLDLFASHLDGALCATVACVIYDRATNQVQYARAGHPPPLIVGPRGHRWLDDVSGPPLAFAPGRPRRDATAPAEHDEILVLYSDGLVERRGESLDTGLERLAAALAPLHDQRAHLIADELLRTLPTGTSPDDIVLVVKRFGALDTILVTPAG